MAQWGQQQQQPGYQYPLQTGFQGAVPQFQQFQQQNPQFQPQNPQFQQGFTGLPQQQQQQQGFPGARPGGFQQPQQTGFQPLQQQQTGFIPSNFQQQPRQALPPPVPPIPPQFQQQNQAGSFLQQPPQQSSRFLSPSPGLPGPGLGSTFTARGNGGVVGQLIPQVTGFVDPRLQLMSTSFMPVNIASPYSAGGAPLLPQQQFPGGLSLQQSFQRHNEEKRGTAAPTIPWALSKAEKKNYDTIFRAWDTQGNGYITGQTALEVFGQSGLNKQELADIWHLADADNKGKLNIAEFHVAMGLIFRRLNGNEIPTQLPPELVPPSRDLDDSVETLKRILEHENRSRSPSSLGTPVSRLKERSFAGGSSLGAGGRQDATVYKHTESEPPGGFYTPTSRRVDRTTVRSRSDEDSPAADLSDMKRQLENTAKMLDRAAAADASRTAEDEALDREMQDLKYRVKRVQEDLEYVSRGPRTSSKDEERRRLERELMQLMHDRVPDVERKIEERERRREREKREWDDARDRRNERHGRFDDRDDRYSSSASSRRYSRERNDDRDRPYSRGSYDRDDSYRRDSRRDRDYNRQSPPPPPPPPAAPPSTTTLPPPPPPPQPSVSPAPNTKTMTPEERQAFLRAEAKRRIDARTQALGLTAPASAPSLDTGVEQRLAQEKKEAEEKAREAERQAEERERLRRERLEGEKALKEGKITPSPTPTPTIPTLSAAPPTPTARPAPPPTKSRPPPPPLPRKSAAAVPSAVPRPSAPPAAVVQAPVEPEVDPEEERIRAREETLRKQREARAARLRQLEEEEEEARRAEEQYQSRRQAFLNMKSQSPVEAPVTVTPVRPASPRQPPPAPAPAVVAQLLLPDSIPAPAAAATPPPSPPPPPISTSSSPAVSPAADKSSRNPFSRLMKEGNAPFSPPSQTPSSENTNPFPRSQTAPPPAAVPTKSPTPTPTAVKTSYHTAPGNSDDEDWDRIEDVDDSSDDEVMSSRTKRSKIAQQMFANILPPARPQSAGATASSNPVTPTASATPVPPPPPPPPPSAVAPPVAVANSSATSIPPPPPPPPPAAAAPPAAPGDVSALLSSIQGGKTLRKVQTVDRSAPPVAGRVLGDSLPPPPRTTISDTPPASLPVGLGNSSHRQSMDWYAGLAADEGTVNHLPSMAEEDEKQDFGGGYDHIPQIQVDAPHGEAGEAEETRDDPLADVDKSVEHRVLSLYAYGGERPEDLSFGEDTIIIAHPSKSGSDWWHGALATGGKSGFFPKTYVQIIQAVTATALYPYNSDNPNELSFDEGDELSIVDRSDSVWWKADQGGAVLLVPATYVELTEDDCTIVLASSINEAQAQDLSTTPEEFPPPSNGKVVEEVEDSSDSSSLYSHESHADEDNDESQEERAAREEKERQWVMQAAGLVVTADANAPQVPRLKRRPAPAAPRRSSATSSILKDLPPIPGPDAASDAVLALDDAFDRYEAFKQSHGGVNRMSVASVDTVSSSLGTSPITQTSSREGESQSRAASAILNFLGRKSPAGELEKRNISGPIMLNPTTPPREASPAFGTSWASLVDRTVLDDVPADERRRQETIFELITTEAAYVRDLQLIVEVFYSSMVPLLDTKAVTVVFANIEDILLVNTVFLSSLEERQKECRLYIDNIGDILTRHIPNMDVYMEYCVNQAAAIKALQSLRESKPNLASHLQRLRDDPAVRNLDLASYLLCPMQRITKYPLLIRQILQHHTEMAQDRKEVETSLNMAEKILNNINNTIREQEGQERLKEISKHLWVGQGRLDLTATTTRNMGPRKLLREGVLSKAKSGRKLHVFLCNDLMILTDEVAKNLYRMPLRLVETDVKGVRDDSCFQVLGKEGVITILRALSARECQQWTEAIKTACVACRKAERRAAGPLIA